MSCDRGARSLSLRCILLMAASAALPACSTLPVTGPTGHDIEHAARERSTRVPGAQPFQIVEIDSAAAVPPVPAVPRSNLFTPPPSPTDLLGPNDVLTIRIYEAGVSLFGKPVRLGGAAGASAVASAADEGTNAETLAGIRVDDLGFIRLPFAGRLKAAGRTTSELQEMIRSRLKGMSQDPQVLVAVDQSITNSVVLAGEVNKPGRFTLPTNQQTLSDVIALAGGFRGEAKDVVARVQRGTGTFEIRLSDLLDLPQRDLPIVPGDRITLISRPETFSVLGAPNRPDEIRFPKGRVSLAQAVALAGGANPNAGDAAAVFVFRYVEDSAGAEQPLVYHLNMMRPGALFLSQRFMMRDKDLLYIGNAQANQPSKLVQLVSQLFVPVATARAVLP